MTTTKPYVKAKTEWGTRVFVGYTKTVQDGKILWTKHSPVRRITREDAMSDAEWMVKNA